MRTSARSYVTIQKANVDHDVIRFGYNDSGDDKMDKRTFCAAIIKFTMGLIIISSLIFIPAGTLKFLDGWIFVGLLFIPMFIVGIILMFRNPELLKKRLNAKEKEDEQKSVILLSGIMFIAGFVIAGLNFRFGWFILPRWVMIVGAVLFTLSYIMYGEVLRENTYLSRTVEVQENQKVIDTGLYGIVRHPMYSATIILFLSIPLILRSVLSFVIFLIYPFIIAKRIANEEKVLEEGLEGYSEYKHKVKYRIIPFVW